MLASCVQEQDRYYITKQLLLDEQSTVHADNTLDTTVPQVRWTSTILFNVWCS